MTKLYLSRNGDHKEGKARRRDVCSPTGEPKPDGLVRSICSGLSRARPATESRCNAEQRLIDGDMMWEWARLVLRVQMLSVIVGLVSGLWLDDVRAAEDGKADVVLRNGKIYTADSARSIRQSIAFT